MEEIMKHISKVLDFAESGIVTPYEAANEIEFLAGEMREWADANHVAWYLEVK